MSCCFKQQQSSNNRQVVRSGHVNGQLSHQLKQGCNLQQQCKQCGSFSWQQPLQSQQVSPQPLLHPPALQLPSLQVAQPLLEHAGAALQLGVLLQLGAASLHDALAALEPPSDIDTAAAAICTGGVGAAWLTAGACCFEIL